MEFCTKLQQRVLDLENTKTAQAQEITHLKLRVKKLEKKGLSSTHKLKRLYKGRKIDDIDKDSDITLVYETHGRYGDKEMFDTGVLDGDEVLAESKVTIKDQAPTLIVSSQQPSQAKIQDKGKAKMIKPEPVKKLSKKYQLKLDEEVAERLQAEFDEQEKLSWFKGSLKKMRLETRAREQFKEEQEIKEVAVDAIPLATKPPSILVKAKYGSTRPVEDLDLVLYGDLKTMFDPHVEDQLMLLVYKLQLSVFRVNAAITKLQQLKRLRLLEDFLLSEKE
ncbi:hypothetical protein Tco_0040931 [Tanacetum coccineum]